ncbi:hypothetical protein BJ742DRAFT_781771 [Cladochytrium replicatum]|nr:hypothetical protein BJ742DRAFT_781771 [Cladochytrium replicatum]
MTAEQMWNMLAMELRDSDFRKVFLFKYQSGELTSFDELYVSFTDFRLAIAYRILSLEPSKRLAEIESNALRAAAYMGKVDYVKHNSKKFQLKKYSAMLNEAALIATERGHEELVRLMAREPTKRTFISARAITGGHWKIILRLMEQGFELDL